MSDRRIRIAAGGVVVSAALNDSTTADALWGALPITGSVQTWGDEIYFSIPVEAEEATDAQATVDKGAVAYWPPGSALCLFWGPTPMSRGDEIRPASPVNTLGLIDGDPAVLARVADGARITVERID
ncbi:MAG: cyclophilin-like fold protein [Acidobacteria bacterium]|nr:cyclophilin-like fold protein [Acidobacteriota bacterium]